MSTAVTSIPPPEEMLTGTAASTQFVTATHGLELGHLATPVIRVAVPEAYEPVLELAWRSWAYSAQEAVGPIADFRDQARWSQRALAYVRRRAAESVADALEERHAHRSSMRAVARDPVFAQYVSLGTDAASVALRRLGDRRYRALWLYVLQSISQDRPAEDAEGLDAATRAWRDWGRRHGLVP